MKDNNACEDVKYRHFFVAFAPVVGREGDNDDDDDGYDYAPAAWALAIEFTNIYMIIIILERELRFYPSFLCLSFYGIYMRYQEKRYSLIWGN